MESFTCNTFLNHIPSWATTLTLIQRNGLQENLAFMLPLQPIKVNYRNSINISIKLFVKIRPPGCKGDAV